MFDIGATELLLVVVVAIVIIGPKDLPLALRAAGRWIAKIRRVSGHFRAGVDAMIREAEMEEMQKEWARQNEAIMKAHPNAEMGNVEMEGDLPPPGTVPPAAPDPDGPADTTGTSPTRASDGSQDQGH